MDSLATVAPVVHTAHCRRCNGFCPSGTLANGLCSDCYREGRIEEIGGFRIAAQPVVEAELAEMAAGLGELMTPHELGFADAVDGEPCIPEMYFARREQMVEYAEGYEAYAGPTLLSRQILNRKAA